MGRDYYNSLSLATLTYEQLQAVLGQIAQEHHLLGANIQAVSARTLTAEESIGNPLRQDYPLVRGRETMLEAEICGAKGQAFTDSPGSFAGTLQDIVAAPIATNFDRALLIAVLNATLRHLGWIDRTIHCKDEEPETCAKQLVAYVRELEPEPRIAFIGLQPAMVVQLAQYYPLRVTDLDPENVGRKKYGVEIELVEKTAEIIAWSNLILATGTTFVNNTFSALLAADKPVVFYGVTVAGIAYLTGSRRFCHCGG